MLLPQAQPFGDALQTMSMLYYKLNGFNDLTLKHVFIASLPLELQPELQRLCEQKDFFKDLIENRQSFASACKKPYLKIQCKDDKKCTCPTKKKSHFQKHPHRSSKKGKTPYRYFKRKIHPSSGKRSITVVSFTEYDDHTTFILTESTDDSEVDEISVISTVQEVNMVHSKPIIPSVKILVLPSKFHKPISVIGFLDTGAQRSMVLQDGRYHPGPHIAKELIKFPDTDLNKKQIQQFFGIVNYLRDFIPKVAVHTNKLSRMLKKQSPPWGPEQTTTVKQIKKISQSPPPLKIATTRQRILQTDTSDEYWSAILLEKKLEKQSPIASGQFKDAEKNYHVIYKDILAVKYGIKKFESRLISHNFLIKMDNSSFPKILDFKNKLLPDKQLLSLKAWFAKYDFTVQHIKGVKNLIPDFLTRPSINKPTLIISIHAIPIIAMYRSLPFKALTQKTFPLNLSFSSAFQIQDFAIKFLFRYFMNVYRTQPLCFPSLHLEHLFLTGFTLNPTMTISEDELWYVWCLTVLYATKFVLPVQPTLRSYFQHPVTKDYWTQDQPYEWKTFPHPFPLNHDPTIISVLKAYLLELNNIQPAPTDIYHTSIGPSHSLEFLPRIRENTPGSSSSPQGILVREECPDYTNVLSQDAQDPWEDFHSLLPSRDSQSLPTESVSQPTTDELDEDKLIYQQIHKTRKQYKKETRDISSSDIPPLYKASSFSHGYRSFPQISALIKMTGVMSCLNSNRFISPYYFTRSIRTLISTKRPHPKEYIQSSRLDQCSLQATTAEQYVTLEIPPELISHWQREGYTHLHIGGVRLILTLHGRKGLPVTARITMLDTRFTHYQDAVIGTVLTTLHAGSVLLTFYPNFNISLQDTNLSTALKVQVQIQGAEQISFAKIATLHHQLVYRLQNHALDLPSPEHHSDALMVLAESDQIPTIIQIPRHIPRHELIKLMPLELISNYEKFHTNTSPIQTTETMFERRSDGTIRMTFRPPPTAPEEPPRLSFTYSAMITAVQTAQEKLPIIGFNSEGYLVYPTNLDGHFLWDSPGSGNCDPDCPCHLEDPKPFEAVLNWQTQNARAQNETLVDIHKKQPPLYTPLPPPPTQAKDKSPMQQYNAQIIPDPSDTDQTSDSNLAVLEDPSEPETESSLDSSISSSDSKNSYADITRILMAQPEETEPAKSSRIDPFFEIPSYIEEDPPEASSAPNRPAQPQNDHKPSNDPWFTFDDISAAKWRDRLFEMVAWTDLQMLRANATTTSVLRELSIIRNGCLDKSPNVKSKCYYNISP
ncbi:hypothetical protein KPL71_011968 [Citrus sinensis]|uniref:Uncharacterized protein n=1 Tax=Citrus sinensis TaxID=2711 RepID=A0ACB8L7Y6_CITSI|nr:hypothetical protein KPL71_011968 [Citrus sinensis]